MAGEATPKMQPNYGALCLLCTIALGTALDSTLPEHLDHRDYIQREGRLWIKKNHTCASHDECTTVTGGEEHFCMRIPFGSVNIACAIVNRLDRVVTSCVPCSWHAGI